jgi:L-histidine N-alpha-methyltransferase
MTSRNSAQLRVLNPGRPAACPAPNDFAADVLAGLSSESKSVPSVYFYDKKGSELFHAITRQSEYYLTRCETEVLRRYRWALARLFGRRQPFNLIELGAGDGLKTSVLIEHFLKERLEFSYIPVDICAESVRKSVRNFKAMDCGNFKVCGLVDDYSSAMRWMARESRGKGGRGGMGERNVVLFLGSTIGNFPDEDARAFLSELSGSLRRGDLVLIGFDLKKDPAILNRAYNDKAGITREFNLNLLDRMNRELGADFDRDKFEHFGYYNERLGAMESWLISMEEQAVSIRETGSIFYFKKGERVHTEYSHKYSVDDINGLMGGAGFSAVKTFFDSRRFFADSLWKVL